MALKPVTDPRLLQSLNGGGAPTMPQPVLAVPNTDMQHDNLNQDRQVDISGASLDVSRANSAREAHSSLIDNAGKLASRYDQLPPVKEYRAVVPIATVAMKAPDDGTGDTSLLYAFAKVNDPGSVVREGEIGMGQSGGSVFDNKVAELKKQFGVDGGGNLSPELRLRIKREIDRKLVEMQRSYDLQRTRFTDDAKAYGIDPDRVIGPHDFSPYAADYVATKDRLFKQDGTANPAMVGDVPQGSTPVFGMDKQANGPFDRDAYLKDTYGITPNQEASITAFWNANRKNPGITAQGVKAFYQQQGIAMPTDADIAAGIAKAKKGVQFSGFDTSQAESAYRKQLEGINRQNGAPDPKSFDAVVGRGLNQIVGGLGDEANGMQRALGAGLMGQDPIANYQLGRDASRLNMEQTQQAQPGMSMGADLVGGLGGALMMPGAIGAGAGGVAKAGALAGGVSGFGNGEGVSGSLAGSLVGAGMGAGLGYAGGKVGDALAARGAGRSASQSAENYAAGQKYGINLNMGDAGGMSSKITERLLDVQPGAGTVMNTARDGVAGEIKDAAGQVAGKFGERPSYEGLGATIQSGARNWLDKFQRVASNVYDAIPIKPEAPTKLDASRSTLGTITQGMLSNPELSPIWTGFPRLRASLKALTPRDVSAQGAAELTAATGQHSALVKQLTAAQTKYTNLLNGVSDPAQVAAARQEVNAAQQAVDGATQSIDAATQKAYSMPEGGQLAWEDMKRLRTIVGQIIGKPGIASDGAEQAAYRKFYGALTEDMRATASAQGPKALAAFDRASSFYSAGQARIDGAFTRLLGRDGMQNPEKAAAVIQGIAKEGKSSSDIKTLAEIRSSLKPHEWGDVSSGLIELLGQPANASGRDFNPTTFVNNYKNMAPEAKNLLFGAENKELRQHLDGFVGVLGLVAKNNGTRNTSNTAMGLGGLVGFGVGGGGLTGAATLAVQALLSNGAAKLWTNPKIVRWATGYTKMVARAGDGQPAENAVKSQLAALSRIAANDNSIAGPVAELAQRLQQSVGILPQRSAAGDRKGGVPLPTPNAETAKTKGPSQ